MSVPGDIFKGLTLPERQKAAEASADAMVDLARAEAEAEALLKELETEDVANGKAPASKYAMKSQYAPGEDPAERDPVKSLKPALTLGGMDPDDPRFSTAFKESTLAGSHTVDFAQKIREAQKPYGNG